MKIQKLKEKIIERIIEASIEASIGKPENIALSFPPDLNLGDFTLECFSLAKKFGKSPAEIAKMISEKIKPDEIIKETTPAGPYLNIRLSNAALFSVLEDIDENFGKSEIENKEKVMIEYLGPNTNKPLHLGHARNAALGIAISKILKNNGYEVLKTNIINDRGVHICKSMLAYQKWGENSTPESMGIKGDHFVGHWYVRYNQELPNNPGLEDEIREMLQKWESGDKETLRLWKKMNDWVYSGWEETYTKFGIEFDAVDYESETYKLGKDVIEKGLEKGVFRKDANGALIFDLPEEEFGLDKDGGRKKITVLRADGTSLYITQDIGTAVQRFEKYDLDKLIYVVASEQDYHFRCLFRILKALGYAWAENLYHLSYGIVTLPEGRMKSREGNVVDTDDLVSEMTSLAKKEIKKRDAEINGEELEKRAEKIGIGAIKFYFLRVGAKENIEFNPKESISFDGFTGPYCQYAYARIASILRKAGTFKKDYDTDALGNNIEERMLIKKMIEFPDVASKASSEYNPSLVATHVFETAQLFNKFYQKNPVLNAETEEIKNARLNLIQAVQILLKAGLDLLGIETVEKM